jgi:response regulator NasT
MAGHAVAGEASMAEDLLAGIEATKPDLVVIDSGSPGDGLLARLRELTTCRPLPVVLFTEEDSRTVIEEAVRAGVNAYIVDGLTHQRLAIILEVAMARFRENQRLRQELERAKNSLAERKVVERAKGILMKQRGFDEPQAYHALRKMAMDRNLRIGEVAENVVAVAELLN